MRQRQVLIVTGEASGDLHGANLIRAARDLDPGLSFFGVGGRRMREAGCEILIPAEDLAVMGLVEVAGRFVLILRAFRALKKILRGPRRPDLVVLIDYPGFNLRLAREACAANVPVLYYIGPKVWAWRAGRIPVIASRVDRLALIFPFEPELYRDQPVAAEYVGHPLLDEYHRTRNRDGFLKEYGLDPGRQVLGLFPGSRRSEIRSIFPVLLETARRLHEQRPDLQFLLPLAPGAPRDEMTARSGAAGVPVTVVEDNIYDVAGACDAVLSVSGTVTLQVALTETPMAILYKVAALTYAVGKRLVRVSLVGLPNIVAGREVVREFLQKDACPENLVAESRRLLEDEGYRQRVREDLAEVRRRLGRPGGSKRVAELAAAMSRGEIPEEQHR